MRLCNICKWHDKSNKIDEKYELLTEEFGSPSSRIGTHKTLERFSFYFACFLSLTSCWKVLCWKSNHLNIFRNFKRPQFKFFSKSLLNAYYFSAHHTCWMTSLPDTKLAFRTTPWTPSYICSRDAGAAAAIKARSSANFTPATATFSHLAQPHQT